MFSRIRILRIAGIAEGVSFLVLLLIAMPLKYYADFPLAVKVVGWIHGVLFMGYIFMVIISIKRMGWNWFGTLLALAASIFPMGTLLLDRSFKRREKSLEDQGV